jgi:hypothetical protein
MNMMGRMGQAVRMRVREVVALISLVEFELGRRQMTGVVRYNTQTCFAFKLFRSA